MVKGHDGPNQKVRQGLNVVNVILENPLKIFTHKL